MGTSRLGGIFYEVSAYTKASPRRICCIRLAGLCSAA